MKIAIHFLRVIVFVPILLQAGVNKLDPRLEFLIRHPQAFTRYRGLAKSAEGWNVDVIVTMDGNCSELRKAGIRVKCFFHGIAVTSIPVQRLQEISGLSSVVYIESCQPAYACLDKSIPLINVNKVRQQLGYFGKGVIVGIIDSGIDWKNRDFIDAQGKTRIKYLLDLSEEGSVYGGVLYTEDDINAGLDGTKSIDEYDYSGHGTHVAGIAAGDDSDTAEFGLFAGVAPEASLVIVKATRDAFSREFLDSDQIIGLAFIDSVAAALQMPYVINMSFGGQAGAHDGTSATERVIDKMIGRGIAGKSIITVAGNDGENNVHAQVKLPKSGASQDITFQIDPYSLQPGAANDIIQFDVWYTGTNKVSLEIITPLGIKYGKVQQGQMPLDRNTAEGSIYAWNGFYPKGDEYVPGANPFNGDYETYVLLSDANAFAPPKAGTWTLRFEGSEATVDVYLASATMSVGFIQGNKTNGKLTIPGTAVNAISVGAYLSKESWKDLDGNMLTIDSQNQLTPGEIASFSSPGPTRDNRIKPDVVAPGQMIASSYSRNAPPQSSASIFTSGSVQFPNGLILEGGKQALSMGTSMAAPHVSGIVALILEKYPEITALQIRDMLNQSTNTDNFVGTAPNNEWGHGKVDAFKAFQLVPGKEPPTNYHLIRVYPNPFDVGQATRIDFELPVTKTVNVTEIRVYNILGQRVRTLLSAIETADEHHVYWDGRDEMGYPLATGVYFIQLHSGSFYQMDKVILLQPRQ